MVDLRDGLGGFETLGQSEKQNKAEDLTLSEHQEGQTLASPASDMTKAEAFYLDVLGFVTSVYEIVARGKEKRIREKDTSAKIVAKVDEICTKIIEFIVPDDLVRLNLLHDECEPNYLFTHEVNVCFIAARLALELNFSREKLQDLVCAALFHDIGMMMIPVGIWNKAEKLTEEEFREIQKHPLYGAGVFTNCPGISEVVPLVIGQHHERADGSGYPGHLVKESAHYMARLLAVVDKYVARCHTRLYRPPFLPDEALQQIIDLEGATFDMHFMKAILRTISVFPVGSWVKISSNEVGQVVKVNEETPMRPIVHIVNNEVDTPGGGRLIDLSKQLLMHVQHCVKPNK